jgi:UDP-N-acetylglucosamine transferase subunit ALG13
MWQTGSTDVGGLRRVQGRPQIPAAELAMAIREADVVITHAGAGSALTALEMGRLPVLVPREAAYGEHVDDHQQQVARELQRRGLAISCSIANLDIETLVDAASQSVQAVPNPVPFPLASAATKE